MPSGKRSYRHGVGAPAPQPKGQHDLDADASASPSNATATSHFVLAVMAGTGTLTHLAAGTFAHRHGPRRAAALSVGVVAGAQLGARLALHLSGSVIQLLSHSHSRHS